jgi:hypothetical protein
MPLKTLGEQNKGESRTNEASPVRLNTTASEVTLYRGFLPILPAVWEALILPS